jgi:Spx/MgsR family transcriptional regulator
MKLKMYAYKGCSTCKKAQKWLTENGVEFQEIPIREQPPTKAELKRMLGYMDGNIRKLFNTSGQDYKALDMKSKLPGMSDADAITLLAGNGNLVKRPFLIGDRFGTVGFKEEVWAELLG